MSGHVNDHMLDTVGRGHINDGLYKFFGGGASPLDPDSTLFYDFAGTKDLIDEINSLPLTFTRSSTARYYDSAGILQTAAINEPRFDHNPVTRESLGLLVEEDRENLIIRSRDISLWNGVNGIVTPDFATAQDGTLTASRLAENDGVAGNHTKEQNFVTQVGVPVTVSAIIRPSGRTWVIFFIPGTAVGKSFDVGNGVLGGDFIGTPDNARIIPLANGNYRCELIFTPTLTTTNFRIYIATGDNGNGQTGVLDMGVIIDNMQAEEGLESSSIIDTTTVAVTRSSDQCLLNDTSWFNAGGPNTIYTRTSISSDSNIGGKFQVLIGDGSSNERVWIQRGSNLDPPQGFMSVGGASQFALSSIEDYVVNASKKTALAWDTNDAQLAVDGVLGGADAAVIPLTLATQMNVGTQHTGVNHFNGHIQVIAVANVRKDNAFLQDITVP